VRCDCLYPLRARVVPPRLLVRGWAFNLVKCTFVHANIAALRCTAKACYYSNHQRGHWKGVTIQPLPHAGGLKKRSSRFASLTRRPATGTLAISEPSIGTLAARAVCKRVTHLSCTSLLTTQSKRAFAAKFVSGK
jgi:hypothetical protein